MHRSSASRLFASVVSVVAGLLLVASSALGANKVEKKTEKVCEREQQQQQIQAERETHRKESKRKEKKQDKID